MVQIKGIDISHWQNDRGSIDWAKVKADGVEFAIVKATERNNYVDPFFKQNVAGAKAVGIKVGAYHFARFKDEQTMIAELNHFLSTIKGVGLTYPAVLDIETNEHKVGRSALTDLAVKFLEGIEKAGYFAMIYSGKSFLENTLDESKLNRFAKWVARYNSTLGRSSDIWQYTSTGSINGIKGDVDVNWSYRDDLKGELNGQAPAQTVVTPAPQPAPVTVPDTYTVAPGDSLSKIASKYDVSVNDLVAWNGIKDKNVIQVGQVLKLKKPATVSAPQTATASVSGHKVVPGDTLSELAVKYKTTVANIKALNGLTSDTIYVGQTLKISGTASASVTHKVVSGDTLSHLAIKYKTTVAQIKSLNGLKSDTIYIGQTLKVK